jgi:ABC-type multidrug transport system permease subunit
VSAGADQDVILEDLVRILDAYKYTLPIIKIGITKEVQSTGMKRERRRGREREGERGRTKNNNENLSTQIKMIIFLSIIYIYLTFFFFLFFCSFFCFFKFFLYSFFMFFLCSYSVLFLSASAATLFRGNSTATKLMTAFTRLTGRPYLVSTMQPLLQHIIADPKG